MQFQQSQHLWASHLRNPQKNAAPNNIEARRMKIYQDLLYSNVEGFIANSFPVLKKITPSKSWHQLVRDFYEYHHCLSPYFSEIAYEFLQYISEERQAQPEDFAFLLELAHYEWVELALDTSQETIPTSGFNSDGDLLNGQPVVSPLIQVLQYAYPVHLIGPDLIPTESSDNPVLLIVYRDRENSIGFMEINAFTARLLLLLQQTNNSLTGKACLLQLAEESQHPDPDALVAGGLKTLQHLHQNSIILGTELLAT